MSDIQLGELIEGNQERDAIHVAIVPMVAAEMLRPGQRVGLVGETEAGVSGDVVGIVDPYLTDVVPKGSRFWLCLLPGTVTGMRHHWEHPAFNGHGIVSEAIQKEKSKQWLMAQCEPLGITFEEMTDPYFDAINSGYVKTYQNESGRDHWFEIEEDFWKHYETYMGIKVPEEDRGGFTCSC